MCFTEVDKAELLRYMNVTERLFFSQINDFIKDVIIFFSILCDKFTLIYVFVCFGKVLQKL